VLGTGPGGTPTYTLPPLLEPPPRRTAGTMTSLGGFTDVPPPALSGSARMHSLRDGLVGPAPWLVTSPSSRSRSHSPGRASSFGARVPRLAIDGGTDAGGGGASPRSAGGFSSPRCVGTMGAYGAGEMDPRSPHVSSLRARANASAGARRPCCFADPAVSVGGGAAPPHPADVSAAYERAVRLFEGSAGAGAAGADACAGAGAGAAGIAGAPPPALVPKCYTPKPAAAPEAAAPPPPPKPKPKEGPKPPPELALATRVTGRVRERREQRARSEAAP
jgi:hypothetical protein